MESHFQPSYRRLDLTRFLVLMLVAVYLTVESAASGEVLNRQLRRPVALSLLGDSCVVVANHRSGSVSVVDWRQAKVLNELTVGQQLADVETIGQTHLLVVDSQRHELTVLERRDGEIVEVARVPVSHTPVSIRLAADRRWCSVASLWARQISIVDLADLSRPTVTRVIDLPFSPRAQLLLDPRHLIVADAFGGHVAIIDCDKARIQRHREFLATHNITGICRSEDEGILVTHQMLNHERSTTASNVHWGDVMANVVRRIDLDWFRSDAPQETTAANLYYLGHPDDATGDPTRILRTHDNRQIVAFAGIDQLGLSDPGANAFRRIDVGRRPTDFALTPDGSKLLVCNRFDDSISVIDLSKARVIRSVSLGPTPPLTLADEGEMLFYDSRLSSDGWFSCHSCHTDGHSNGQLSDTFGDGYRGAPKRVLTLLGTVDTGPWAWNGSMSTLEDQIAKSLITTMRGTNSREEHVKALTAYVRTLAPAPAITSARRRHNTASAERGRQLFHHHGCVSCHAPGTYTSNDVHDVGLEDADGNREFNPPSLIGVSQRQRLLHDNRADSYQEALQVHPAGTPLQLSRNEWLDLQTFLDSL